jgi:hypothetical protein
MPPSVDSVGTSYVTTNIAKLIEVMLDLHNTTKRSSLLIYERQPRKFT